MLLKSLQDFNKHGFKSIGTKFFVFLWEGSVIKKLFVAEANNSHQKLVPHARAVKIFAFNSKAFDCFLCAAKLRILLAQPFVSQRETIRNHVCCFYCVKKKAQDWSSVFFLFLALEQDSFLDKGMLDRNDKFILFSFNLKN